MMRLILILIASNAFAEEHLLSHNFINRIEVKNDRISQVIGNQDEYIIDSDGDLGQVFITPLINGGNTLHLKVITESGKMIDIDGKIEDIDSQSIILAPEDYFTKPDKSQIISLLRKARDEKIALTPIKDPECLDKGIFIEGWEYKTTNHHLIKLQASQEVGDFSKCSTNPLAIAIEKTEKPTIYIINSQ